MSTDPTTTVESAPPAVLYGLQEFLREVQQTRRFKFGPQTAIFPDGKIIFRNLMVDPKNSIVTVVTEEDYDNNNKVEYAIFSSFFANPSILDLAPCLRRYSATSQAEWGR